MFGTEKHGNFHTGWLKLIASISSNNIRNCNKHQYVGRVVRSRSIVGNWYPIVSIDFHEHSMTGMMVLRQGYV